LIVLLWQGAVLNGGHEAEVDGLVLKWYRYHTLHFGRSRADRIQAFLGDTMTKIFQRRWWAVLLVFGFFGVMQDVPAQQGSLRLTSNGFRTVLGMTSFDISVVEPNVVRIDASPDGVHDVRTPVLDPSLNDWGVSGVNRHWSKTAGTISTPKFIVTVKSGLTLSVTVADSRGTELLREEDLLKDALGRALEFTRSDTDPVYGIEGIDMNVKNAALARTGDLKVSAGIQGNGGAPMFFTRHYAVLVDSVGGAFSVNGARIGFHGGSRREMECFIIVGDPLQTRRAITRLSGPSPMPPRWALGFLNSQWGSSESEIRAITQRYRAEHIPLDGFIMDFDWKAWGEDDYGEWRWNSTSGAGNRAPDLFPGGASGVFAANMRSAGVHLTGIMKPRILLYKPGSTMELDDAATYAQRFGLWYPDEPETIDYVTHRPSRDLNFNLGETRGWFWKHLQPAFDSGIEGFWNDEADRTDVGKKQEFRFNDLQHFNMARAEYEGQREHSDKRVWTLNRNFYLGAQRYSYAEWSGDIASGDESMAEQPVRMLAALNIGEEHWSMDTGGFHGHPSPENYARWVEFAAFVPIFRVHGDLREKRQPWIYGADAQSAATKAIDLRYSMMPYLYATEAAAIRSGVGLVRPLGWIFPNDMIAAQQTDEWMFGDALLVAPILEEQTTKSVYLPEGTWWEYASGHRWEGHQSILLTVDREKWSDIPLFVRAGSILATNPVADDTDAMHPAEVTLDVYPASKPASFVYYEDDGRTYAYEKGSSFRQEIVAKENHEGVTIYLRSPVGSFEPSVKTYLLRVHGVAADAVKVGGVALAHSESHVSDGWYAGTDRFGPVTTLKTDAARAAVIALR
jgi:alpha-glucosidase